MSVSILKEIESIWIGMLTAILDKNSPSDTAAADKSLI